MKERPIPFSGPMVRAIMEGCKTQTRRVVKWPNLAMCSHVDRVVTAPYYNHGRKGEFVPLNGQGGIAIFERSVPCPYGVPGDRLYCREKWKYVGFTEDGEPFIEYAADGKVRMCKVSEDWSDRVSDIWAKLSEPANFKIDERAADRKWRPSLFMPRWASRITLEVVSVRVERLQEISEEDAKSEGIYSRVIKVSPPIHVETRYVSPGVRMTNYMGERDTEAPAHRTAKHAFECLWESINGYGSWFDNPLVWVVEFKKLEAP